MINTFFKSFLLVVYIKVFKVKLYIYFLWKKNQYATELSISIRIHAKKIKNTQS